MATSIREHFLRQAGTVSLAQARAAGLSYRQVQHRVETGEWLAVRRGVYRLHAAAPTPETGLWAAVLWLGPEAVLVEEGAVWLWEIDSQAPGRWAFASARGGSGDAAVRLTRSFVDPTDVTEHRGVRVMSRPWAVLTAAAHRERVEAGRGVALVDRAKQTRAVRQEDLSRAFSRHPGCWGSTTIRRILARTGDGAQSELERLALSLLRAAGIAGWVPNHLVRLHDGTHVEIDVAFPERRLALELDGFAFHSDAEAFRKDVRRGNRLMASGWTVRRFTWDDLLHDPDGFVATVVELLQA